MKSLLLAVLLAVGCSASLAAPYPAPKCGYRGHECSNGTCCPEDHDCGGDVPGCPSWACCYAGPQ